MSTGFLLTNINDLVSMFFLLILFNISIKLGSLLYLASFIFYWLIQLIFVKDKYTVILIIGFIRFIIVIGLFSFWRRNKPI
jgi:hypothetical protein